MTEPIIKITGLNISFDDEVIHKDFSLTVNKGEKIAITGESGSGKSTLLNAIVDLFPIMKER
nr:ATP-binding cassette domain-containing protein [Balneicella halophila]